MPVWRVFLNVGQQLSTFVWSHSIFNSTYIACIITYMHIFHCHVHTFPFIPHGADQIKTFSAQTMHMHYGTYYVCCRRSCMFGVFSIQAAMAPPCRCSQPPSQCKCQMEKVIINCQIHLLSTTLRVQSKQNGYQHTIIVIASLWFNAVPMKACTGILLYARTVIVQYCCTAQFHKKIRHWYTRTQTHR